MILRGGLRLASAAGLGLALTAPVFAQSSGPNSAELDPSAPLAPLPDIGVDWPDLDSDRMEAPVAGRDEAPVSDSVALRYTMVVRGLEELPDPPGLAAAFAAQSVLHAGRRETANPAQIERRSRADAELLAELLRAQGYYDADVTTEVEARHDSVQVALIAQPGPQYSFESVELPGLAAAGKEADALRHAFAVEAGDPVVADEVIAAGVALQVALGEEGFALAKIGEQQIDINHETRRASLELPVDPGPIATFGAIRVSGEPPFGADHVGRIARFDRGEPFRRSRVDDLRRALIATGLVASADVTVVPAADGRTVDLNVTLVPAPMRTIAGELGYGTGEGLRAEANWQHRNFFNPEGALTLRGVIGTREQLVSAQVRRSNFRRRDQVLNLLASISNTELDAYDAKTIQVGGGIERQSNIIWHKKWTWSLGAEALATSERGVFGNPLAQETKKFIIVALPASLYYDGSDDLLNPTQGFRLGGRISPEISAYGGSFAYGRLQMDASAYRPVSGPVVLAGRVRIASIVGASTSGIAPSRRIYSGGGGSVRGYGFQRLGPRDARGDPIGGRGLAEFAVEARYRLSAFGGNFGIVPFIDGGTLSDKSWPNFQDWQFGAGIGLRYYSNFGPIRVDVGTPLNPRSGDSRIAVTVSLGQAF
ncbi:MAG TPA: BamA/TamA family outer membrane protein [Sphingomicrobium sp.]|nr:BamA/TamA family outer membrane protein [Sphingomicrobium sp.]